MKILIIKPSSLGDVIHAIPLVHDIKDMDSSSEIHWLVNSSFADVVKAVNGVDKVILFDRHLWRNKKGFFKGFSNLFNLIKLLQSEKYDAALDLQGLFRSAFFTFISKAKRKIGFKETREPCSFLYSEKVNTFYSNIHAVDKNRRLVQKLFPSFDFKPANFNINIPLTVKSSVEKLLKTLNISGKFCILSPDARWKSKKWPFEHYLTLSELIADRYKIQVLITGCMEEKEKWEKLITPLFPKVISAAGQTSLLELAELFSRCEFSVTNDSGPMHLSVAMNKKVYALLGPTSPDKTGPYRNAKIIKSELNCCPCFKKECPKNSNDSPCMAIIKPEHVINQFNDLM